MATSRQTVSSSHVSAVIISSSGEFILPKDQYRTHFISTDHNIFADGELSAVSMLIGVPLRVLRHRPSLLRKTYANKHGPNKYSSKPIDNFYENPTAGKLMVCCAVEEKMQTLAFATPREWQGKSGDVLVARADKTPLYPHHIKSMLGFIADVDCNGRERLTAEAQVRGTVVTEQDVIDGLTPLSFREYYVQLRETWNAQDEKSEEAVWLREPSLFIADTVRNAEGLHDVVSGQLEDPKEYELSQAQYQLEPGTILSDSTPRAVRGSDETLELTEPTKPQAELKVVGADTAEEVVPGEGAERLWKGMPPHRRHAIEKARNKVECQCLR